VTRRARQRGEPPLPPPPARRARALRAMLRDVGKLISRGVAVSRCVCWVSVLSGRGRPIFCGEDGEGRETFCWALNVFPGMNALGSFIAAVFLGNTLATSA
jgi:hypothetical protein